jgi:hypothetical protein
MINQAIKYIFFAGFFALLTIAAINQCDRNKKIRTERDGLKNIVTHSIDTGRNKLGEPHATVPVVELSESTLRTVTPELDSIESRFNTSTKRVITFISIQTERNNYLRLAGKDTIMDGDTVKYFKSKTATYIQKKDSLIVSEKSGVKNTYVVIRKGKRTKWWKVWSKRPTMANVYITDSLVDIKDFKVHSVIK